jgi:hypothetical protein
VKTVLIIALIVALVVAVLMILVPSGPRVTQIRSDRADEEDRD